MKETGQELLRVIQKYSEYDDENTWGYSCTGMARKAVEALKEIGLEAKIFSIELPHLDMNNGEPGEHALVFYDGQKDDELCLNQYIGLTNRLITVGEAKEGKDITIDILRRPWSQL